MTEEVWPSGPAAGIQEALLAHDFESLAKAIGDKHLEDCGFSDEIIQSPCLEDYAKWWLDQREFAKAVAVYKFVSGKRHLTYLHFYQYALVVIGQREEALSICLEAINENRAAVGTYWNAANLCMDVGRHRDAKQLYLQAKKMGGDKSFNIDEKLQIVNNLVGFYELWNNIKNSRFSLDAAATDTVAQLEFSDLLRLATGGDKNYSVELIDWNDKNCQIGDFANRAAVAAGRAFQSNYMDEMIYQYQYEAIKTGAMSYLCPKTGAVVQSDISIYIDDPVAIAYFFNTEAPFFLIVESVSGERYGLYFPLDEAFIGFNTGRLRITVCYRLKHILTTKWAIFKEYFEKKHKTAIISNILNHWGHTLLNEYPSLECLFEHGLLHRAIPIVSGMDGYITIRDIFNIDFEHEAQLATDEAVTDYVACNNLFVVRPTNGKYRLPLNLRRRLLESCNRLYGEDVRRRFNKADYGFVAWIEIRSNDRICLNQDELACEVVKHLEAKNMGRVAIFIAGWSKKLVGDRDSDIRMIQRDLEVAEKIAQEISTFSNAACFNVIGCTIYEKVTWAQFADVHVCVLGTGECFSYLVNKPLIVHANSGWYPGIHRTTSNIDIPPEVRYVVGKEFIEDTDSQHYHIGNYACKPAGVLQQLDKVIANRGIARIQDILLENDFAHLAKAIGDTRLEDCQFSDATIASPCLEDYAKWLLDQQEFGKAADVYKFISSKRPVSHLHFYQYALVRNGQQQEAIEVCLEAINENRANVGTYWNVANLYMGLGRHEEAKRFYLQAQGKPGAENFAIAAKLRLADSFLGLRDNEISSFFELWNKIKSSNFSLAAEAAPQVDYSHLRNLADNGDKRFSVDIVDWNDKNCPIGDFASRDAVDAGLAFQADYVDELMHTYQYEAIKTGAMSYRCPQTGEVLHSNVSIYIDHPVSIAYFFNGKTPFFLLVEPISGLRNGLYFPLEEVFVCFNLNRSSTLVCLKLKYNLTSKWPTFKNYFENSNRTALISNVLNHWGHTILNEYPSLDYLFDAGLLNSATTVVSGVDGYINIKDVFNIDFANAIQLADGAAITDYVADNNLFIVRPTNGPYRLPSSLRRRLLECSDRLRGEDVRRHFKQADFGFAVWIEVRSNDRICLNQVEVACEIVRHLDAQNLGRIAVFIAGWSKKLVADRPFDMLMIERDSEIAGKIAEGVAAFSDAACFNIIGRTIYEKILWAELADVHVCVVGTGIVFAYLSGKPLVLHGNAGWYPEINTPVAADIPVELMYVVDKEFIEDRDDRHYHLGNYECKPAGVLKQLDAVLAKREALT